ncbi:MAG: hypothetical protein ACOYB3_01850 [Azonexus sp.]
MICAVCQGLIEWLNPPHQGGWFAHEEHPDDNHDAVLAKPTPEYLVAMPLSSIYGHAASEHEGWGLVDPGEDDPAVIECVDEGVATYLAYLWNRDHAE